DLIPMGEADLIISLEPMEALRYLPYLKKDGYVITNSVPFVNIPNYPDQTLLMKTLEELPHKVILNAEEKAKECGNVKVANIVMLGAATPFIGISYETLREGIRRIFSKKGESIVELNLRALEIGKNIAESK
ncbi:MAG TPA: indolepyruvate oxidoreductase, partial [Porphyromonadaceae bacterium]|nr:indolepyruvate oxidoreductase [Porphyromonadaceae bacterium]